MTVASAYPAYRESGLPWVPLLPEGWQVLRNGRLFGHRVEIGFPDLPILEVSLRTGVRVRDMENLKRKQVMSQKEKYKRAIKNDIAYNMMRMWQGAVGPAPVDGLVSPAYVVVKPYAEANSSYYSYLFRTAVYMQEVNKFSRGIVADRNRLYWESFKQMPSLVPPRPEQDQIVAYLRAQDADIARFIKAKRDLIKLLTEQKLRIIDHAVTRGLDPSITLKSSGIEWLGEVPAHWDISRLKYCVSQIHAGGTPDTGVDGYWSDSSDGIPWLLIADVTRADRVVASKKRVTQAGLESKRLTVVPAGAVLYTMYASIGKAAILEIDAAINQAILGLEPKSNVLAPEFLFFWLRSLERHIKNLASTSTQANLNAAKVKALPIFLPSVEEQKLICRWIKNECRIFEDAIARTEEEIKLIREYRDRLIADVVTGQVDVRGWQPGPDDVVDDAALAALGDDQEDVTEEEDGDGED
jgi:type I restriction enzyme, S subunit